jgi:hypothetical protein
MSVSTQPLSACSWRARDVLAGLVVVVWGIYVIIRGHDYPAVSPLEWLGGLGLVLGAVAKFYGAPPATTDGGGLP